MGSVEVLYRSKERLCEIMIKFYFVVIAIAFISCDRKPDISGHWVSVPDDDRINYYTTIDIIDSLLIEGSGSLTEPFGR